MVLTKPTKVCLCPSCSHSVCSLLINCAKCAGTDHQRIAKLDRENEVAPPAKVNPSVGKAIQTARAVKELSQKDLAQKINEKPTVIQEYESGRAIPSPQILGKLERALGVKLRGVLPPFSMLSTARNISYVALAYR